MNSLSSLPSNHFPPQHQSISKLKIYKLKSVPTSSSLLLPLPLPHLHPQRAPWVLKPIGIQHICGVWVGGAVSDVSGVSVAIDLVVGEDVVELRCGRERVKKKLNQNIFKKYGINMRLKR